MGQSAYSGAIVRMWGGMDEVRQVAVVIEKSGELVVRILVGNHLNK
jgi:hypothetical protein